MSFIATRRATVGCVACVSSLCEPRGSGAASARFPVQQVQLLASTNRQTAAAARRCKRFHGCHCHGSQKKRLLGQTAEMESSGICTVTVINIDSDYSPPGCAAIIVDKIFFLLHLCPIVLYLYVR